ncbi:calnexin-like [Cimex lectularius]|uniref:Calnexin n=1 Tax=Cimex lectularius TaxID=79782 RepID=A0A8I6STC8_CIMLE|nr:calnexin-like [Cimex lectularius]
MFSYVVFCFVSLLFIKADGDESALDEFNPQYLLDIISKEEPYFAETFDDPTLYADNWIPSQSKKEGVEDNIGKYDGDWLLDIPIKNVVKGDMGLTFKDKAKHRAITAKLSKKFSFKTNPLIIQYEVTFQNGQECGGGYMKLYSEDNNLNLNLINDKSPYTIMFGPDKCGSVSKIHFIFRHKNPKNGSFEEKHGKQPANRFEEVFTDSKPHLFTLVIYPNNNYKILIDQETAVEGSLLEDFTPPVNPPAEIDDPNDKKPEDFDDREKIPDPTATKPEDWDESEPRTIPDANAVKPANWLDNEPIDILDPSAEKPDNWDEEMDGEWEAPLVPNPACEDAAGCGVWTPPEIPNPKYKGKWSPPLIPNPAYRGKWEPRKIPNPDYFHDENPFVSLVPLAAVGFELWSMSPNIFFDNILITDDENFAQSWSDITFRTKIKRITKESASFLSEIVDFTNQYPWLWAVYTLVLLFPITLFVYFCIWSKQDKHDFLPCGPRIDEEDENESPEGNLVEENAGDSKDNEEFSEPAKNPQEDDRREKREGSEEVFDFLDGAAEENKEDNGSVDGDQPVTLPDDESSLDGKEEGEVKKRKPRKLDD